LKLEVAYKDISLFHEGKSVIDPFCIIDMGLKTGAKLTIKVREILLLRLKKEQNEGMRNYEINLQKKINLKRTPNLTRNRDFNK